jgi:hypothetical protein
MAAASPTQAGRVTQSTPGLAAITEVRKLVKSNQSVSFFLTHVA